MREFTSGTDPPRPRSELDIAGKRVRLLSVDDLQPRVIGASRNGRARKVYVTGEIAHFEFEGHRYALVAEDAKHRGPRERANPDAPLTGVAQLTNRELQICQLICMGYLTKQVADRLKLSQFTVRSYLKTVYCKLSVRSRGAMVYRFTQAFGPTPALNGAIQAREPESPE